MGVNGEKVYLAISDYAQRYCGACAYAECQLDDVVRWQTHINTHFNPQHDAYTLTSEHACASLLYGQGQKEEAFGMR